MPTILSSAYAGHEYQEPIQASVQEVTTLSREDIDNKIDYYSEKWGVSKHLMHYIVLNESSYNEDAVGDMHIICRRTGEPVRARGPVQITECYYPQVNDEDAFDWDYSLNFLAKKLSRGKCHEWTTCRNYYQLAQN